MAICVIAENPKGSAEVYRFAGERLAPAWEEFGVSRDDVTFTIFEAHSFMAGDLSGAAQPAERSEAATRPLASKTEPPAAP